MKMKELQELDAKGLVEKLEEVKAKLVLENPSQIKFARRDIARIETELRQRELKK